MGYRSIRPPTPAVRILAATVMIWLSVGTGAIGTGAEEDRYPLTVGVATCPTVPQQAGIPDQNCTLMPGVTVDVRSDPLESANSESVGTCVTGAAADGTCNVPVPFEQDFYVYVSANDQATTLASYAPSPTTYPLYVPSTPAGVEPYPAQFIVFLPASEAAGATPSAEQAGDEMSLSISFYTCQSDAAAGTLPGGCTPASEEFSFQVMSLEGSAPPASQDDATRVGDAYVLNGDTLLGRGLYRNLAIGITGHPEGLSDYLATGEGLTCDAQFDFIQFTLPRGGPPVAIAIYTFPPLAATPAAGAAPSSASTPASDESTPEGTSDTAGAGEQVCRGTFDG